MSLPSTHSNNYARRTQKDNGMTKLHEVPLTTPPTEFNDLKEGSYTLRAPFFHGDAEGGALQVGLQPDEYESDQKQELAVTVSGDLGQHAIALARLDGQQFSIESSDNDYRKPVLSRPVAELIVRESLDGPWLGVEADGDDPLDVDPAGLNYLTQILTAYTLRKQAAARTSSAQAHGN